MQDSRDDLRGTNPTRRFPFPAFLLPALVIGALVPGLSSCAKPTAPATPATASQSATAAAPAAPATSENSSPSTSDDKAPTLLPAGVHHVGLNVPDLEASKTFFVEVLGFSVQGKMEDYPAYALNNGHILITLWQASDPSNAVPFDRKKNIGLHHLAFAVASFEALDAMHLKLKAYPGVVIEFAPEPLNGGPTKHMMFRGPSGNRLELIHRPTP